MGWENSELNPPKKPDIYYVASHNETRGHLYSYWNGERWGYRTSSKESAPKYANDSSPQGQWPWYWEEGVDQPYMKKNAENDLPARNGAAWTIEEEQQLLKENAVGLSIEEIAKLHKRVPRAIEIRLDRLTPQWKAAIINEYTIPKRNGAAWTINEEQQQDFRYGSQWNPEFLKQKSLGIQSNYPKHPATNFFYFFERNHHATQTLSLLHHEIRQRKMRKNKPRFAQKKCKNPSSLSQCNSRLLSQKLLRLLQN